VASGPPADRASFPSAPNAAVTRSFVDTVFTDFSDGRTGLATVLVARDGSVFVNAAYRIGARGERAAVETVPNFPLLGLSAGFNAALIIGNQRDAKLRYEDTFPDGSGRTIGDVLLQYEQTAASKRAIVALVTRTGESYSAQITRRIFAPLGIQKTIADSLSGELHSNVEDLYRWEQGLSATRTYRESAYGWRIERYRGMRRESEYGTSDGKRNAFVRFPDQKAAIIILTSSPTADTRAMADRIADRLLFSGTR
jgi:hypothetical protein